MRINARINTHENGFSLVELLVAVPISAIVVIGAYRFYNLTMDLNWAQEKKSFVISQNEITTKRLKTVLTPFVRDVTGVDGSSMPPPSFWNCSGSGCTMDVTRGGATYRIIDAQCEDVENSDLKSMGKLNDRSVSQDIKTSCLQCPAGQAPKLTVSHYHWEGTSTIPILDGSQTIPPRVGRAQDGLLAYGICVQAPGYSPFNGFMGRSGGTQRYDRWTITLIPVFANKLIPAQPSEEFITNAISTRNTAIMISGDRRLGGDSSFTPIK
jgi:prepilin-type N-terminal cleavage/methylation domain-containing protein